MINFTDAQMNGAQDKKFEGQFNYLVELLSTYLTRGLISSVSGDNFFDLKNGEFFFGKDEDNYIKFDGTNFSFKGSVTYTGGNLGDLATKDTVGASDCDSTIINGGKIITSLLTSANSGTYLDLANNLFHCAFTDGSYMEVSPSGLFRHVGSTDHDYHYLIETGSVTWTDVYPTNTATVTLPSEYQGKAFKVICSLSAAECDDAAYAIRQLQAIVSSINTAAGTFVLSVYVGSIDTDGSFATDVNATAQVSWVAIV